MSWIADLADRFVLCPSTHPIPTSILSRETVESNGDELEIWTAHVKVEKPARRLLLIKFPGTRGRAENSTTKPADQWHDSDTVLWTVNPFGYGQSGGKATLQRFPEMVDAIGNAAAERFPDRKVLVFGNSLGALSALRYAAKFDVEGVLLRNPVPVHQMISRRPRYAIPSLGMSRWIAAQIPQELNAIENAAKAKSPCVFVSAQKDRVAPPRFQEYIIEQYAGEKRVLPLPDAGHDDPIPPTLQDAYLQHLRWLIDR